MALKFCHMTYDKSWALVGQPISDEVDSIHSAVRERLQQCI